MVNVRRVGRLVFCAALIALSQGPGASGQTTTGPDIPHQIISAFDTVFGGVHPGSRAVHAKGVMMEGVFAPSPGAAAISRADHLQGQTTPVLVRFSAFPGAPDIADGAPGTRPDGMAIRFLLPDGVDTDIVALAYDGFPAATPVDYLEFLRALPNAVALSGLAAAKPAVNRFLNDPMPVPASYGTQAYFGVNAFIFSNSANESRPGRYRIVPVAGTHILSAVDALAQPPNFLAEELRRRVRSAPVEFRLLLQLAGPGDNVTDGTVNWPEDRPVVELGRLTLPAVLADQDDRQRDISFTPTNLVGGIAASDDPMLLARTQAYRISADRRGAGD